jgi:hypothetical protein
MSLNFSDCSMFHMKSFVHFEIIIGLCNDIVAC